MSIRMLQIPIALIALPVNRVYFQEAARRFSNGEDIGVFSFKLLKTNIKLAIIPISLLVIFGEPLFSLVFGNSWKDAGKYAAILGFYELFFFCASCLSGNFVIIGKQKINLIFSLISVGLNVGVFLLGILIFDRKIEIILIAFIVVNVLYYLINQGLFLCMTGVRLADYLFFALRYVFAPMLMALFLRNILYYFQIL